MINWKLLILLLLPTTLLSQVKTYHLSYDSLPTLGEISLPKSLDSAKESDHFVIHNAINTPTNKVRFKANYDSSSVNFYITVVDTVLTIKQQKHDSKIFATDDCVEIFIDFDGDGKNYLELGVNPNEVYYDYKIICPKPLCGYWDSEPSYNLDSINIKGTSFVTTLNDIIVESGYGIFISLPYSSLLDFSEYGFSKPIKGTKWRVNIFNINQEEKAYNAWSSTKSFGFHQPQFFGEFIFD